MNLRVVTQSGPAAGCTLISVATDACRPLEATRLEAGRGAAGRSSRVLSASGHRARPEARPESIEPGRRIPERRSGEPATSAASGGRQSGDARSSGRPHVERSGGREPALRDAAGGEPSLRFRDQAKPPSAARREARVEWAVLSGLLAAALVLSIDAPALAAPASGKPAPDFTATGSDGKTYTLHDYKGKTVVLEWTNHQCPYVEKHYETGNMQALQREATGQGVVWLSVISSAPGAQGHVSPAQANQLTSSRKAAPSAVLLDPKGLIGRVYDAQNTPHMYVINREGVLVYQGAIDDRPTYRHSDVSGANNYVRGALTALANGQPVKPAVTRAYGCTVKYD